MRSFVDEQQRNKYRRMEDIVYVPSPNQCCTLFSDIVEFKCSAIEMKGYERFCLLLCGS